MNQILATENEKNNHNKEQQNNNIPQENTFEPTNDFNTYDEPINDFENTYEPPDYSEQNNYFDMNQSYQPNNYSNTTKTIDSKKIIIFFAIIIMVFGLAIGGVLAFKMYKNKQIENSTPEVSIEEIEGNAKISAFCKKGISKVTYYWNEGDKTEIPTTGETVEKLIELPKGENTLTVLVEDSDGKETSYTKSFSYYTDKEKPVIIEPIEFVEIDGEINFKIVAEDETELESLTYQIWEMVYDEEADDEVEGELLEEETIYPEEEGTLTIETNVEIKRGKQKLKIMATDTSNNTAVKELYPEGIMEPEIDVTIKGEYLYIIVSHDIGIKEITYTINGKEYIFDENSETYEEEKLQVKRKKKLKEGENIVELVVYTLEAEDKPYSYKGKKTYTPSN